MMAGLQAGLWGVFGGFAVEGLELYAAVQRYACWPWHVRRSGHGGEVREAGWLGYVIAELVRLLIGGGLAWAASSTGYLTGSLGALAVGAAAPGVIGQLMRAVPLPVRSGTVDELIANSRHPVAGDGALRRLAPSGEDRAAVTEDGDRPWR
jgi:hypothetical protein